MKKIAVIPNVTKDKDYTFTKRLVNFLESKAEIVMPSLDEKSGIKAEFKTENLFDNVDNAIILGGDGTMLQVAEPCGKNGIPVMGINLGKVGFMTEVEIDDVQSACTRLLADDYAVESRMMMDIEILKSNGETKRFIALNDTVISKPKAEMIAMELHEDDEKVSEYIADGLIISTPTGSTGYSLSAGGPVADPTMDLFIATPICAHQLSARPMLLSDKKRINLRLSDGGDSFATVTVDGEDKYTIGKEDVVSITRSEYRLKIIKLGKQSFYNTMMMKL